MNKHFGKYLLASALTLLINSPVVAQDGPQAAPAPATDDSAYSIAVLAAGVHSTTPAAQGSVAFIHIFQGTPVTIAFNKEGQMSLVTLDGKEVSVNASPRQVALMLLNDRLNNSGAPKATRPQPTEQVTKFREAILAAVQSRVQVIKSVEEKIAAANTDIPLARKGRDDAKVKLDTANADLAKERGDLAKFEMQRPQNGPALRACKIRVGNLNRAAWERKNEFDQAVLRLETDEKTVAAFTAKLPELREELATAQALYGNMINDLNRLYKFSTEPAPVSNQRLQEVVGLGRSLGDTAVNQVIKKFTDRQTDEAFKSELNRAIDQAMQGGSAAPAVPKPAGESDPRDKAELPNPAPTGTAPPVLAPSPASGGAEVGPR